VNGILPTISVIVPVLNGERTIRDCLVSVLQTDYPPDRREVLVVDNASTDRTASIVTELPVQYLWEGRRGPAAARNAGIVASRGKIVAFTDADCVVTRGWFREIERGFADGAVGAVAGEVAAYPPRTAAERYAARIGHLSPKRYLAFPVFPFAITANVAFRREVFDTIGGFDPALPTGEGVDLFRRFFRGAGMKLHYAPRALVLHRHRSTSWGLCRQFFGYGRGHALVCIKYRDEHPWGWKQSMVSYRDLARSVLRLARTAVRYRAETEKREALVFSSLELLHKMAYRLGFMREALSRGYLYF
jgi:glycosyltransferase involved in cell wall biosynthesis